MKYTLILIAILSFGCRTAKEKVSMTASKYPSEFRDECIQRWPATEKTIEKIKVIPGKPILVPGKLIDCDSVKPKPSGKKQVECPPSSQIVDTFYKEVLKVEIDNRALDKANETISVLTARVNQLEKEKGIIDAMMNRLRKTSAKQIAIISSLSVILGVLLFFYLKKIF